MTGRKILFVATKKQAKEIVAEKAAKANMPYITERWPGGMLTNFVTIRKAVKKMQTIDRMKQDGRFDTLSKKEKLQMNRLREKLEKNLGSIADMTRLPGALFVVDIKREHIAIKEAQKLNIPIFAMVDTNSDPRQVDYLIPSNDDASKSIDKIVGYVADAVIGGLAERKAGKESGDAKSKAAAPAPEAKKETPAPKAKEVPAPVAQPEDTMANITAADVNKLRKATGAGMMDCKKALVEAEGDFDQAIAVLRKKGQKIAEKRADRDSSEGAVVAKINDNATKGVLVSLNCETDFVAKNSSFVEIANKMGEIALGTSSKEEFLAADYEGMTVAEKLIEQTGVIGEKIQHM